MTREMLRRNELQICFLVSTWLTCHWTRQQNRRRLLAQPKPGDSDSLSGVKESRGVS
jgi:hypothetical protein